MDYGLTNGTIYYYGIFPCTTENVYTTTYSVSAMPSDNINGIKIVTFADGTDEEIVRMLQGHYNDEINIADYWSVGDMRTIHIDAMQAIGVGETHVAQDQQFVIIGIDHDDLETEINGHTKAAITIQPLRVLSNGTSAESGYMNSSKTSNGGWEDCVRRIWCNDIFYNALPSVIKSLVKTVSKLHYKVSNNTLATTIDKVFLLSEIEIFGTISGHSAGSAEGTQYEYFKTTSNRMKYIGNTTEQGSDGSWWERSQMSNNTYFCRVDTSGGSNFSSANNTCGLCPAFCL